MNKTLLLSLLVCCALTRLSAQGIQFEEAQWVDVLAKAKKENKLVYVDVYTTWCGPCKMLARDVFPKKEAGDYYNGHFVNYRLDAEKGEGIALAKQYNVEAYPTHLFIDPASSKIIFRTAGAGDVSGFVHHGEIAELERADPMTLPLYQQQFAAKKTDTAYLKKYLEKLQRLDQNNDEAINAYLATLPAGRLSDRDLNYLALNLQTIDNQAFDRLYKQQDAFQKLQPGHKNWFNDMAAHWAYTTFDRAAEKKDFALAQRAADWYPKLRPGSEVYAREALTEYWDKNGNDAQKAKAKADEANYLTALSNDQLDKMDNAMLEEARQAIRFQAKDMGVADSAMDKVVEDNLNRMPAMRHGGRSAVANRLNGMAWGVYEQSSGPNAQKAYAPALLWAKRSLEISKDDPEAWVPVADTYARLLYVTGKKAEAIKVMEEAVPKAKALRDDAGADYEETLGKMKAGTL